MLEMMDFSKYGQCLDCKDYGSFCPKHRKEVEELIEEDIRESSS